MIGGSGSGKTFRFVKPNLIQMNSSNIVVDPKDHLAEKTGKLFFRSWLSSKGVRFSQYEELRWFQSFRYIETENDLNRMLTVYFNNTKGSGSRSDPFWDEASMTLVRALASYLVDFYNPPKTREQLIEESRLSQTEYQNLLKRQKKRSGRAKKTRGVIQVLLKSQNSLNTYPRVKTKKKCLRNSI